MYKDDPFDHSYLDVTVHKMMLEDVIRTEAYENAIQKVVKPGDTVIDFGCGTSVLSIFSSRAGAKQVYAVDRTKFIRIAQQIAKQNSIPNIEFHHADQNSLQLDEKVDVLISEWMGHFLFYEDMLGPLLKVRDKFLKEGGVMIPRTASLHAGLLIEEDRHEDLSYFNKKPYNIDFGIIAEVPHEQLMMDFFSSKQLMTPRVELGTLNLETLVAPPEKVEGTVIPDADAMVYGIVGWFSAEVAKGVFLGTGPDDPPTHWNQLFFPLVTPFEVKKGKELSIEIVIPTAEEPLGDNWVWGISDEEKTVTMDNMRFRRREEGDLKGGKLPPCPDSAFFCLIAV